MIYQEILSMMKPSNLSKLEDFKKEAQKYCECKDRKEKKNYLATMPKYTGNTTLKWLKGADYKVTPVSDEAIHSVAVGYKSGVFDDTDGVINLLRDLIYTFESDIEGYEADSGRKYGDYARGCIVRGDHSISYRPSLHIRRYLDCFDKTYLLSKADDAIWSDPNISEIVREYAMDGHVTFRMVRMGHVVELVEGKQGLDLYRDKSRLKFLISIHKFLDLMSHSENVAVSSFSMKAIENLNRKYN